MLFAIADGYHVASKKVRLPGPELSIWLSRAAGITGHVRDEHTGEPVRGVVVSCVGRRSVTRSDGSYVIQRLPIREELDLRAEHDDYAVLELKFSLAERETTVIDLQLQRGALRDVLVRDRDSLEPLVGVQVREDRNSKPFAVSDSHGMFSARAVEGASVDLLVNFPGYAMVESHAELAGSSDDRRPAVISMRRLAWIEGTVRSPDGEPVDRAILWAARNVLSFETRWWSDEEKRAHGLNGRVADQLPPTSRRSDASGAYILGVFPSPEPFRVKAQRKGYVTATSSPVRLLTAGDRAWVDLVCEPGASIQGRVLLNGEPWMGMLRCLDRDGVQLAKAHTDENGRYRLAPLPGGEAQVVLQRSGQPPQSAWLSVGSGDEHEHDVSFRSGTLATTIMGRVLWETGEPVAKARVTAMAGGGARSSSTYTAEDGRFSLEVESGREYSIAAQASRYLGLYSGVEQASGRLDGITAGATEIELVLDVPG